MLRAARLLEPAMARQVGGIFRRFDVVLTPTTAQPPLPVGAIDELTGWQTDRSDGRRLPLHLAVERPRLARHERARRASPRAGAPVGAQLVGPEGTEALADQPGRAARASMSDGTSIGLRIACTRPTAENRGESLPMPTVREATFDLFRAHGMTTIFGNPGSTELPMLAEFPEDFRYILGLQELVVVGMADGYAQATGRPTHVNLHTAPGVGNAVGGIFNAQANKSPLVITAGQQVRAQITIEANLTNRDATLGPQPYVKWSHEPPRPEDVPGAIARAIHHAMLPPRGPAFVSIPMDDWNAEADADRASNAIRRVVDGRAVPDPASLAQLASTLAGRQQSRCSSPGPTSMPVGDGRTRSRWPRSSTCRSGPPRRRAAGGLDFPESHPNFVGVLPPAIGAVSEVLKPYDLVLVVGSSVFPYYPYFPGPLLPEGASLVAITSDPAEAARAPMGDAIVGDVALALKELVALVDQSDRPAGRAAARARRSSTRRPAERLGGDGGAGRGVAAGRNRGRSRRPRRRWHSATACGCRSPAATTSAPAAGSALGSRRRWVSSSDSRAGRWSASSARARRSTASRRCGRAVAYKIPVTFLVLRNQEYMILKWFAEFEQLSGAPGLELPGLDVAAVARAYGMSAREVSGREELIEALREDIAAQDGPRLLQVPVASGMWLE